MQSIKKPLAATVSFQVAVKTALGLARSSRTCPVTNHRAHGLYARTWVNQYCTVELFNLELGASWSVRGYYTASFHFGSVWLAYFLASLVGCQRSAIIFRFLHEHIALRDVFQTLESR